MACRKGLHKEAQVGKRCLECHKLAAKRWHINNPEQRREANRRNYRNHKEARLAQMTERRNRLMQDPEYRAKKLAEKARWKRENPAKRAATQAKRRAAQLQRTPKWLTKEHLAEIKDIYLLAKELQWLSERTLAVDHIIPLQGENVSGLHVPWNLQILPEPENCRKSNNYGGGGLLAA